MSLNPVKKAIYKDVFGDFNLDSSEERKENLAIIDTALNTNNIDTVRALFQRGPLEDGYVPCKNERDWMLDNGYCAKVIVDGEDGYNACTHKGAWLHRCMVSLYRRFNQGACEIMDNAVTADKGS